MTLDRTCIALIGAMGSGKSSVANALGERLGWLVLDTDEMVETTARQSIADIFRTWGEAAFRGRETEALTQALQKPGNAVVATGGGVVLAEANREMLAQKARVVWLDAPAEVLAQRVGDGAGRPLLAGGSPLLALQQTLRQRNDLYAGLAEVRIDVSTSDPEEIAAQILDRLGVAA